MGREKNMLKDIKKNKAMLEGAYKKLKAYYYHTKSFSIMRQKIADFEDDRKFMDKQFNLMAEYLSKPNSQASKEYFDDLVQKIDFFSFPKKFESSLSSIKENVASNTMPKDKNLKLVNFFIDMPIQLYIIDSLWTILLGKMSMDEKLLSYSCYGNTLAEKLLYNNADDTFDSINFKNNRMFNIYFYKYTSWRNNAFKSMEDNYEKGKHSILISLDIKNYYYSVKIDFSNFNKIFKNSPMLKDIKPLTNLMYLIYEQYFHKISKFRKDLQGISKKAMPLPIGLLSSMVLGNIYLASFDEKIKTIPNITYYGRYVDDLLFVYQYDKITDKSIKSVMKQTLLENGLLKISGKDYCIATIKNLLIQDEKVKIIHVDPNESKAMFDVYNNVIKIYPSQLNVIPDYELSLTDFDESVYYIENFAQGNKIRDIGKIGIESYKVSRYFSTLIQKQKNIVVKDLKFQAEAKTQIDKINKFFTGSQSLEYYNNWMNYMYFLVLCGEQEELVQFYRNTKKIINHMNGNSIDRPTFSQRGTINKKTKETLIKHLNVCISSAMAIDIPILKTPKLKALAKKLQNSNMFNHNLIALPLSNYIEYDKEISYTKLQVKDIVKFNINIEDAFKVKWSPRFIRFEELFFFLFIYKHNTGAHYNLEKWIEKFYKINNIRGERFNITESLPQIFNNYQFQNIIVNSANKKLKKEIKIAVGNLKISEQDCRNTLFNYQAGLNIEKKKNMINILKEAYGNGEDKVDILVLPELYASIYWLSDLVEFSKRSQIAIVTGLQYMVGNDKRVYNYIATILPFRHFDYKNAFLHIREKNDYSPIEKEGLAQMQMQMHCTDAENASYQIFRWNNIDIGTCICFEFTDIIARALFKGNVDIIAVPEFNPDTSYFSDIISSATRDLHAVIVQANTSIYGDSRITCPYDRDSKDIVKIKGGENDHIIIGVVNLKEILQYQADYNSNLNIKLNKLSKKKLKKRPHKECKLCEANYENYKRRPQIKKLSARFDTTRAKAIELE